jgi:hypothetical protein
VQVEVKGQNLGLTLPGVVVMVEVDGIDSNVVAIQPLTVTPGGVLNGPLSPSAKAMQGDDTVVFVMPPARGQGLQFSLVVTDPFR